MPITFRLKAVTVATAVLTAAALAGCSAGSRTGANTATAGRVRLREARRRPPP